MRYWIHMATFFILIINGMDLMMFTKREVLCNMQIFRWVSSRLFTKAAILVWNYSSRFFLYIILILNLQENSYNILLSNHQPPKAVLFNLTWRRIQNKGLALASLKQLRLKWTLEYKSKNVLLFPVLPRIPWPLKVHCVKLTTLL